jgi:hypothetical protein
MPSPPKISSQAFGDCGRRLSSGYVLDKAHLSNQNERDTAYRVGQPGRKDAPGPLKDIAKQQTSHDGRDQPQRRTERQGRSECVPEL